MRKLFIIILLVALAIFFPREKMENLNAAPSRQFYRIGKASWYSLNSPGINRHTASNEVFDDKTLTCAMWGVQFNRKIKVTNLENGKSIVVRCNDRGPHERFVRQGRIIDLTKKAFEQLTSSKKGVITVKIEYL